MNESQLQIVRVSGFLLAGTFALALQQLRPHARPPGSARVNVGLGLINALVLSAVCGACACSVAHWAAQAHIGAANVLGTPLWVNIPVGVAMLDLVSYGWHRANHRIALLWRFHRVHHSDPSFTVSTGVRFHPGELLLSLPIRLAVIAAVGAPAVAVVTFEIIFTIANLLEHGDIDLPRALEARVCWFMVTPALHRRHHGQGHAELDSNFGTVFSLWDRVLGTYGESSSAMRFQIGLPSGEPPSTVLRALALPLAPTSLGALISRRPKA